MNTAYATGRLLVATPQIEDGVFYRSVVLVLHHDTRLLNNPDSLARARRVFRRILAAYAVPERLQAHERAQTAAPASLQF